MSAMMSQWVQFCKNASTPKGHLLHPAVFGNSARVHATLFVMKSECWNGPQPASLYFDSAEKLLVGKRGTRTLTVCAGSQYASSAIISQLAPHASKQSSVRYAYRMCSEHSVSLHNWYLFVYMVSLGAILVSTSATVRTCTHMLWSVGLWEV